MIDGAGAADYLIPDGMTLTAVASELTGRLGTRGGSWRQTARTYYDTFDGLLHEAGESLTHEDGQLVLRELRSGQVRARQPAARPAKPLFGRELEPGPLRDALLARAGVRALLELVEIRSRERPLGVLDSEHKTVVRLALQQPTLIKAGGARRRLRPRVCVTGVRGYDRDLARVDRTLGRELGLRPAEQPLVEEAIRASGVEPGGTPAKLKIALRREQRADSAAVAVLNPLLSVIEANLGGTIADTDSEFLHDLRVAVRRARAVERELRGVFDAARVTPLREELRWLGLVTGDARDLDVYVLDFEEMRALVPAHLQRDLEPLVDVLRRRRLVARRRMVRALRSERTAALLSGWRAYLDGLEASPTEGRPDAQQAIAELAGRRIATLYKKIVKMGETIDETSSPERYHELRKRGKELRYLLELFGTPLYPTAVVKPMVRSLKALQDVLGRHQDREIQVATVRSLGAEVAAGEHGSAALMAMGVLVEQLERDQREARASFAGRFAAFAARSQRRTVRETFG